MATSVHTALLLFTSVVALAQVPPSICPPEWSYVEAAQRCYKVVREPSTWNAAQRNCAKWNATLAGVPSRKVDDALRAFAFSRVDRHSIHLGLHYVYQRPSTTGMWLLANGTLAEFFNWDSNRGDITFGKCAGRDLDRQWHVGDCDSTKRSSVCELPPWSDKDGGVGGGVNVDVDGGAPSSPVALPDSICPPEWRYVKAVQRCYKAVREPATWNAAQRNCAKWNATLAGVPSRKVDDAVRFFAFGRVEQQTFHLGLHYVFQPPSTTGEWRLANGTRTEYFNWDANRGETTFGTCAQASVGLNGQWHIGDCDSSKRSSICELPPWSMAVLEDDEPQVEPVGIRGSSTPVPTTSASGSTKSGGGRKGGKKSGGKGGRGSKTGGKGTVQIAVVHY